MKQNRQKKSDFQIIRNSEPLNKTIKQSNQPSLNVLRKQPNWSISNKSAKVPSDLRKERGEQPRGARLSNLPSAEKNFPQTRACVRVCVRVRMCVWAASATSPQSNRHGGSCRRRISEHLQVSAPDRCRRKTEKRRWAGTGWYPDRFYVGGFGVGCGAEWACRPPPALSASNSNSRKSLEAVSRNMKQDSYKWHRYFKKISWRVGFFGLFFFFLRSYNFTITLH